MTRPIAPDDGPPQTRPVVDVRTLWAGGVATAIVAALAALVGVVVCRWLFNIPLLSPQSQGTYGDAHTTDVVILAAAAALLATGLAHLLLTAAPRPMTFFTWIVALVTLLMVLFPFSTSAPISQKIATAAVDLVIGFAIGSLLNGVGSRAVRQRRVPPRGGYDEYNQDTYPQRGQPGGYYNQGGYDQNQWGPSGRSRGPAN
jgi:membrane associated rhomboid family serine protease